MYKEAVMEMKKNREYGNLDDHEFFEDLRRGWHEKESSRNCIKELLESSPKLASYVNTVADEKTQKKVRIYVRQKKDPFFIPFDVREKMQSYSLKEYMEAVWPIKFRLNSCQCHLPGHKDRTASCHVYPNTNSFYCFGCHRGGSLVDFLMYNDKMDIKQAIDYIKHL